MFVSFTLFHQSSLPSWFLKKVSLLLASAGVEGEVQQLSSQKGCHVWRWHWSVGTSGIDEFARQKLQNQLQALVSSSLATGTFDYVMREGALQPAIKLALFDMDSTLIQAEVMDALAQQAGVGEAVSAITASAMAGEIDFIQSFQQRLDLLRGFSAAKLDTIYNSIELMPGAERLMKNLVKQGVHCVIVSGGFTYFAKRFAHRLGMQAYYANELGVIDGQLTGQAVMPIVDDKQKLALLTTLCQQHGWPIAHTLAVGDGANDLPMLTAAGMGVAFHAKPIVQQQAPHSIQHFGLDALLHVLGWHDDALV